MAGPWRITFPPVMRLSGQRPSQDAKWRRPPAGHIEADLADDGLGDADVDAVDARQMDAADPVKFLPEVELRSVTASLPSAFDAWRRCR